MLHPLPNTGKDNAPYHHKRSFLSFSAMKTKKDLIEAMVGVGVKKVTLPVKEGVRTSPLEIDLSDTINVTASYKPTTDTALTATDTSAEFFEWKYAASATKDGTIPTVPELKSVCVLEMNENHRDKLQCDVRKLLTSNGHTWLWTPPYCPWLQPIETFWAHGKNHAAAKNRNGRTMRECMVR